MSNTGGTESLTTLNNHKNISFVGFWSKLLSVILFFVPIITSTYIIYLNKPTEKYRQTFTLDVGSLHDTDLAEFYLEPSPDLSSRMLERDGSTYRLLNGYAYTLLKPKQEIRRAKVAVKVKDKAVTFTPPILNGYPSTWQTVFNFTESKTPVELGLSGQAFPFDGGLFFNGEERLELADTSEQFENGPLVVYLDWTPTGTNIDRQQLVGHFNWEIYQNINSVVFQVGRMNNEEGPFYSISQPIDKNFFGEKHHLLAIYQPGEKGNGYIALYVDDILIDKINTGDSTILDSYGSMNLTLGKSAHSGTNYYEGSIHNLKITNDTSFLSQSETTFTANNISELVFPLYSATSTPFRNIVVSIEEF